MHQDESREELADVAIYVPGLAEMIGVDLETEIDAKMAANTQRRYEHCDGVAVRIEA